jgi:zinc/manganese transport system substrate-binding protein
MLRTIVILAVVLLPLSAQAVQIVAAENFYGDVAVQIGGPAVTVISILSRPEQDPHLFEASPSTARAIAHAGIIVANGIDYDPWMAKLVAASPASRAHLIDVAALTGRNIGDNPHIWYDTRTMLVYASALTDALVALDAAHEDMFRQRLARFQDSLKPVSLQIAKLRDRFAETEVTATEPVLGYLFDAIGLRNRNARFQLAIMNDTEPAASEVAGFESDLRTHRVKMLVYNSQASDPVAERMVNIAQKAGVPIVGATETEPPGLTYQAWLTNTLNVIERALSRS